MRLRMSLSIIYFELLCFYFFHSSYSISSSSVVHLCLKKFLLFHCFYSPCLDSTEEACSTFQYTLAHFSKQRRALYSHICKHSTILSHYSSGGINIHLHSKAIMDLRYKRPQRRKMKANHRKFNDTNF